MPNEYTIQEQLLLTNMLKLTKAKRLNINNNCCFTIPKGEVINLKTSLSRVPVLIIGNFSELLYVLIVLCKRGNTEPGGQNIFGEHFVQFTLPGLS